ncbi:MAG TPA: response regulator [Gemmatimonadaceae bacterium]|jgi:DNA-binding NtrC family response regulator
MTFEVVLGNPEAQQQRVTSPQGKEQPVPGKAAAVRVLVVDDEPSICKALTMALSRAGYDAISALSGEQAIAIVRGERVDVLLVDLRIPDMRGDVFFELASSHQPMLKYRTLFMTGDITEKAQKLIGACNCNFLRKPFDLRDMLDAVAALEPRVQDAVG